MEAAMKLWYLALASFIVNAKQENQSVNQSINQSINLSINQSINHLIDQSVGQIKSIEQLIDLSTINC